METVAISLLVGLVVGTGAGFYLCKNMHQIAATAQSDAQKALDAVVADAKAKLAAITSAAAPPKA